MLLAFVIFIMLTNHAYTASLASTMVIEKNQMGEIKNINDAIELGSSICATNSIIRSLSASSPMLTTLLVSVPNQTAGYKLLDESTCQAVLGGQDLHRRMMREAANCNKMMVGEVTKSVALSLPASGRYAASLSYWMVNITIEDRLTHHLQKYDQPDRCAGGRQKEEVEGMTLKEMVGTYFIVGLFAVLAFCYRGVTLAGLELGVIREDNDSEVDLGVVNTRSAGRRLLRLFGLHNLLGVERRGNDQVVRV